MNEGYIVFAFVVLTIVLSFVVWEIDSFRRRIIDLIERLEKEKK